jgi:hypothetical protein
MSGESDTLQVRTDAPESVIARLREHGFNGFVFRGKRGWLTVVPYGGPTGLHMAHGALARAAAVVSAPVLHFQINDGGWGFELALPDGRTTGLTRLLEDPADYGLPALPPAPPIDTTILAVVVTVSRVQPFLNAGKPKLDDGIAGYKFAEAMGFAQFEALSPRWATDDPDEMRRRGGLEVGSRPVSERGHASP